jgi:hypothetical protein
MTVQISGTSGYIADFSNATVASRQAFQTSTTNGSTGIYALPNGTSTASSWQATNAADPTNASKILIATNGSTDVQLVSGINGTGTYLPLTFYTNGAEKMRLDTAGNLGIGTTSPTATFGSNVLQLYGSAATEMRFTSGNSGTTGSDGLSIGIDSSNITYVYNRENTALVFGTNNTERARIDSSGNLLVGTTGTPSGYFPARFQAYISGTGQNAINTFIDDNGGSGINSWVATASGTRTHINFYDGAVGSRTQRGSITSNGSIMTYGGTSDYRLKENVQPMVGALEKVAALKPCTYVWKESGVVGQGFIAHELQEIVPDAVVGEKDAVNEDGSIKAQQIDTSFLVATLTAAIQEQQALITQLQADVASLKAK